MDLKSRHQLPVPSIHDRPFFGPLEDLEPPPSPGTGNSYTVSPSDDVSASTSRPGSPELVEHAEDDTAVKQHPTQHVDYLSHDWREEDIWSSWRYIVSKRGEYTNGPRLENASWRTWMKNKYRLKTVSPETLNWYVLSLDLLSSSILRMMNRLKDCDVTWLYGPLQTHGSKLSPHRPGHHSGRRHGSFSHKKKPILKKRSMSEIMLQRSLSSSSLLKQATAAVQAQQKDGNMRTAHPNLHRASTDYIAFPFSSRRRSDGNTCSTRSTSSSGVETPAAERKHIHFDEQVQQCIAVEIKGDEDEEDELEHARWAYGGDSDSDDDAIMMKPTRSTKKPIMRRKTQSNPNTESKTIAMLPSTTLKYRVDPPVPTETAMKHSRSTQGGSLLSPSTSQETLRPSRPSGSLHYDEDDEEALVLDEELSTPMSSPVDPTPQFQKFSQGPASQGGSATDSDGLRRTDSGMLMPVEESSPQNYPGLVGRVVETVNTARDIVHVIWNVGWR